MDASQKAALIGLIRNGASQREAAEELNVHRETIRQAKQKDADFAASLADVRRLQAEIRATRVKDKRATDVEHGKISQARAALLNRATDAHIERQYPKPGELVAQIVKARQNNDIGDESANSTRNSTVDE